MLGLGLRALWWRRGASLAVLVAAALAVLAAAVGPLWAGAAEESLVRARLAGETVSMTGFTATRTANSTATIPVPPVTAEAEVLDAMVLPTEVDKYFGRARGMLTTPNILMAAEALRAVGTMVWREGQCAKLAMEGSCPVGLGEVMLSRRSAEALEVAIGDTVVMASLAAEPDQAGSGEPFPTRHTVTGLYAHPDDAEPYWFDRQLFGFTPPVESLRDPRPTRLDAVFVAHDQLSLLSRLSVEATAERALDVAAVRTDALDLVEQVLTEHVVGPNDRASGVDREAALLSVTAELADERSVVRTATLLVSAQLLVLAWFALGLVVTSTTDARSGEVALAKLRGLPVRTTVRHGLVEPLVLLLLAVPVGTLLAYGTVRLLTRLLLVPDTPVTIPWPAAAAVGLALAGAAVTVAVASRRTLRQPVIDQLRRVVPTTPQRRVLIGEALVLALAAIGVYQLSALGSDASESGLGLLTPGLVALAAGLITGRLVVLGARVWARRTRLRPRVPAFLASRQIGRRQGLARTAVLVTVAVGISTFAVEAWSIARDYRVNRAAMEVGADTVLEVGDTTPLALAAAVERADPEGAAMAVAVLTNPLLPPERQIVAVDGRRLATVAAWQDEWSGTPVTVLADRLSPDVSSRLHVQGTRWRVEVETTSLSEIQLPLLLARVRTADGTPATLPLGALRYGEAAIEADSPICEDACRVVGLTFGRPPGALGRVGATVVLRSLSVDGEPGEAAFTSAADWRPGTVGERDRDTAEIVDRPDGIEVSFVSGVSETPAIDRADIPFPVPAVMSTHVDADPTGVEGVGAVAGLDGETISVAEVGSAAVLPALGRYGMMVDIDAAGLTAQELPPQLRYEVWLAPGAPASTVAALEREGLQVRGATTLAARAAELDDQGPALALLLLLFGAVIALVTAATAAVASSFVEARRRAYELAALRTVGVGTPDLRRAAAVEHAVLLSSGVVLGIVAGVATAWLARATIPVTTDVASGPPLGGTLSWSVLLVVAAAAAVVLGLAGWLGVRRVVASSRPALLREVQA